MTGRELLNYTGIDRKWKIGGRKWEEGLAKVTGSGKGG